MRFSWPDGKRVAVSLSFDDARVSNPDIGIPLLDRYGIKATWYVLPGPLDQRLEAWKRAAANGHEMGNHTMTHPCSCNFAFSRRKGNALEDYTLERIERELIDANAQIELKLGVRPRTFAYTCGDNFVGRGESVQSYIPVVARHFLAGRGFLAQSSADPVTCDLAHSRGYSIDEVDFGFMKGLIDKGTEENGWVILVGHDTGTNGYQSVRTDALDELCRYAKDPANGIWIDTVAGVAEHVAKSRQKA